MLIPVPEAFTIIRYKATQRFIQDKLCLLADSHQRILASDLHADRDYPPYDRVMMDGICYSSQSTNEVLELAGTLHAGEPAPRSLSPNEAWRINTGAALPNDCDLVVPVEELSFSENSVRILKPSEPYQFVHRTGSDTKKGDIVLPKGSVLNAAALSIAASVGHTSLPVIRTPRVFILTTGKEAIPPENTPTDYQIRRSHPTALATALRALGITDTTFLHLDDNENTMRDALESALKSEDVILTCGAISKGTSDFLGNIFRDLLGEPEFHGVAQRPGRPLAFWASPNQPLVFALPGNALSTLITFHRYVAPALKILMGHSAPEPTAVTVEHDLPEFHLTRFLPVRLDSPERATLLNPQNSGDFSQLAGSHGFVEIELGKQPASPIKLPFYPWL